MPIDYSIAAIPTVYNGIRYRSRPEAKWAAFFDLLNWKFVYEPADFGSWSPDFLLVRFDGRDGYYVEVKPINAFDAETAAKMVAGSPSRRTVSLLLVGIQPFLPCGEPEHQMNSEWRDSGCGLGWSTLISKPELNDADWDATYVAPTADGVDIFDGNWPQGELFGREPSPDTYPPWGWKKHCENVRGLWAAAVNTVQYLPK
jgi:hypothetical protein